MECDGKTVGKVWLPWGPGRSMGLLAVVSPDTTYENGGVTVFSNGERGSISDLVFGGEDLYENWLNIRGHGCWGKRFPTAGSLLSSRAFQRL